MRLNGPAPGEPERSKTVAALDTANNRLQELMQLLYLLSRDPDVPKEARYHVTIALSEIALLARVMQNAAETGADKANPPAAGGAVVATTP